MYGNTKPAFLLEVFPKKQNHCLQTKCLTFGSFKNYHLTGIISVRIYFKKTFLLYLCLKYNNNLGFFSKLEPIYEEASKRVPILKQVDIQRYSTGTDTFSPDGHWILGETSEVSIILKSF